MSQPASDIRRQLEQLLAERILVFDGATGTMIQGQGLEEADFRGERFAAHPTDLKGDNDLLCLTRPDVVRRVHDAYLAAGADIIETNTFNATSVSQADYGLQSHVAEINRRAAEIALEAAAAWSAKTPDKPRFVAGSIGPTSKTLSISPDVNDASFRDLTFDELKDAYAEQTEALVQAGVHVLLIETIFDTLNAKAAIVAAHEVLERLGVDVPIAISVTITDRSGRTLSGQTIEAFWTSVEHARPIAVGMNCSLGATDMRPYIAELAELAPIPIWCFPNAGLPNAFGEYEEGPETTAALLKEFAESGLVNIVGGCCGTDDRHIAAIAAAVAGVAPRVPPTPNPDVARFSGLEVF